MVLSHEHAFWAALSFVCLGAFWWLIPLAIQAGTSLFASKKQGDAAKQAAQTQVQYGDKAIAAAKAGYEEGQRYLQPFAQGGTQAFTTMSQLMGVGSSPAMSPSTQPMASAAAAGVPAQGRSVRPTEPANWYFQGDGLPPLNQFGQEVYKWQDMSPQKLADLQVQSAAARQSGYVTMQAPDGSVNEVPWSQVPHFLERRARVLPPAQSSWTPDPRNS